MTYSDSNPPQGDLDYYVLVVQDNRGLGYAFNSTPPIYCGTSNSILS